MTGAPRVTPPAGGESSFTVLAVAHRGSAGALAWLIAHAARNRVLAQLRRLRAPRNAIALLAGAVYVWFFLVRRPEGTQSTAGAALATSVSALLMIVGIAILVAYWWTSADDRSALAFSPAEVQLLFPAPVPRRALIHYKLLQAQLAILVNTLVWVVILSRSGPAHAALLRALALWVLFSTLTLHRLGAALVRASVAEHGSSGARRSLAAMAIVAAVAAVLLWALLTATPPVTAAPDFPELLRRVERGIQRPLAWAVLLPLRWMVAPIFAATPRAWAAAMLPALAVLAAHYAWVLRTDTAFEDAAVEASRRRAERLERASARAATGAASGAASGAATRTDRRSRPWLPLAPTGHPWVAITWKNIVFIARSVRTSLVVLALGAGVLAIVLLARADGDAAGTRSTLAGVAAGIAAMLVFFGPLWVRNDLRLDMLALDVLKSYPLSGRATVGAELAASTAVLSALHLALVAAALALIPAAELPAPRWAFLGAALVLVPAVDAMALALQNAAALLFPAWVRLGAQRRGGVESLGQNLITGGASLILLALMLTVPALLAAGVALALWSTFGPWALVPAGLTALAALAGELALLLRWLGRVLERNDPVVAGE